MPETRAKPGLTRRLLPTLALTLALAGIARAVDPAIPPPQGFVTDLAGVIAPDQKARIVQKIETLRAKTGAEIAVLTVKSTAPLDDFSYALKVAEAWKIGAKDQDTGVLIMLVTEDRHLRILTGYGVEGILPDGLVGRIQDREMVPAFRAGRIGEGLERGVNVIAQRIMDSAEGKPPPREEGIELSPLAMLLLMLAIFLLLSWLSRQQASRGDRGFRRPPDDFGGGFGGGGGFPLPPGGFGGGGGGFGGFGGGSFGGGGAGRSW